MEHDSIISLGRERQKKIETERDRERKKERLIQQQAKRGKDLVSLY